MLCVDSLNPFDTVNPLSSFITTLLSNKRARYPQSKISNNFTPASIISGSCFSGGYSFAYRLSYKLTNFWAIVTVKLMQVL